MCGILGQLTFGINGTEEFKYPDIGLLSHRGPDGEGKWLSVDRHAYLAHSRLAILEPTPAGYQPMESANSRYVITFNGEIYNHLTLRSLLPERHWNGTSDTETLIELLAQYGKKALGLLKGMFAFACYDQEKKSLLLVRDRLGIKPIWYWYDDQVFRFSSEIRPLLPAEAIELDRGALSEYFAFGRMPNQGKSFNGIQSMPPGSWMEILETGEIVSGIWWPDSSSLPEGKPLASKKAYADQVCALVTRAVEEHLLSDVGVGSFLSGGIDSSIITMLAGQALGKQLSTYTVGFSDNLEHDERRVAAIVAAKAGSNHHEIEINEYTCLNWVKEAVLSLDAPSVDAVNTYIVSKAVQQSGVKVALSGLGGDELFGGYPSFSNIPMLRNIRFLPSAVQKHLFEKLPGGYQEKLGGLQLVNTTNLTVARRRFVSVETLKSLNMPDGIPFVPPALGNLDTMAQISWAEIQGYMMPMLLRDSDQMGMAVGLEIRVPYLDHELVENVLRIPQRFKKGSGTKPLLVDAFRSLLPPVVYNRPKQGFSLPMDAWMRGPLADFVAEGIDAVSDLMHTNLPGTLSDLFYDKKVHWTRLWSWVVLGHWSKRNVKVAV